MIYPALHLIALLTLTLVTLRAPAIANLTAMIALVEIAIAPVLRQISLPRPSASIDRLATRAAGTAVPLAALYAAFVAGFGSSVGIMENRLPVLSLLSVLPLFLLLFLLLRTTHFNLDGVLYDEFPFLVVELLLIQLLVHRPQGIIPLAVVALSAAVAIRTLLSFVPRKLGPGNRALYSLLLFGAATLIVQLGRSGSTPIDTPVVAIALIGIAVVFFADSTTGLALFVARNGFSIGLVRSLLTYYGVPFRTLLMRRMYRRFAVADELAFDVGAHVGNRVVALRALGIRTVAIEPQPLFSAFLRLYFAGDSAVTVESVCLGSVPGEIELAISSRHPTLSTASPDWKNRIRGLDPHRSIAWEKTIVCQVRTLDELCTEYGEPSLIKIDVEGFEAEVLRGLTTTVRCVSIEYLRTARAETLQYLRELERLGTYYYNLSHGESMKLHLSNGTDSSSVLDMISRLPKRSTSGDIYATTEKARLDSTRYRHQNPFS